MKFKQWFRALDTLILVGVCSLMSMGCERNEDYSRHFKHTDDPFYKGTYVVRETTSSIFSQEATHSPALRQYRLLDTDIEGVESEIVFAHSDLWELKDRGFRVIVR